MKRIAFVLAMAFSLFVFISCSKEWIQLLFLYPSEIYTSVGREVQLQATDNNVSWNTENSFVAEVNDRGVVVANHVGKTFIVATSKTTGFIKKCPVEVSPIGGIREPVVDFGITKDSVISIEPRPLVEIDEYLCYISSDSCFLLYQFKNDKLSAAVYRFPKTEPIMGSLTERYLFVENKDDTLIFVNDYLDKYTMVVTVSIDGDYLFVSYMPQSSFQKSTNSFDLEINEYLKYFSSLQEGLDSKLLTGKTQQ